MKDYPTPEQLKTITMLLIDGPRPVVAGYNSIEAQERGLAIYVAQTHSREMNLWFHAVTVLRDGMIYGIWEYTGDATPATGDHLAWSTKTELCGAAAFAAKGIIDLILAGQYNLAYAGIRHIAETVMQINFLTLVPQEADRWHGAPGPDDKEKIAKGTKVKEPFEAPGMGEMKRRLLIVAPQTDKKYRIAYESVFQLWKEMCKGAHPSHEGVSHAFNEETGTHSFGPKYDANRVEVALEYGLIALDNMIMSLRQCAEHSDAWHEQANDCIQAIRKWHTEKAKSMVVAAK